MKNLNKILLGLAAALVTIAVVFLMPENKQVDAVMPKVVSEPAKKMDITSKDQFIEIMYPIILQENFNVLKERARFLSYVIRHDEDISDLKKKYKTNDINELKKRIQPIPVALAMAQASIESAWGTSRFAREGNNFFGMRSYDPNTKGMKPKRATGFVVISYDSIEESVAAYMRNLNTHKAYSEFRTIRDNGGTPEEMVNGLKAYSETKNTYLELIMSVIKTNNFSKYDS